MIEIRECGSQHVLRRVDGESLAGANLRATSLPGADLAGRILSGADLTGADLSDADLGGTHLFRTQLQAVILRNANLAECRASRASFDGSDLSHAILSGADLSFASLRGANLTGALLRRVIFDHTDLTGADLRECELPRIQWSSCTVKEARFPLEWIFTHLRSRSSEDLAPYLRLLLDHAEQNRDPELWNAIPHLRRLLSPFSGQLEATRAFCHTAITRIENALRLGKDLPIPAAAAPPSSRDLPRPATAPDPRAENLPLPSPEALPKTD